MYPFVRLAKELLKSCAAPPVALTDWHVSQHVCWPWDLDPRMEVSNGRTLTLFDMGRTPLVMRTGLFRVMRDNGWGIALLGNTTRYRHRLRVFDRLEMHSRCIGWDARFVYVEQSIWKGGVCSTHVLQRMAIIEASGIVPPAQVLVAMGRPTDSPALPVWVLDWIAAEAHRPWPPAR
jgi:acyl-CoA thioesterase FadM